MSWNWFNLSCPLFWHIRLWNLFVRAAEDFTVWGISILQVKDRHLLGYFYHHDLEEGCTTHKTCFLFVLWEVVIPWNRRTRVETTWFRKAIHCSIGLKLNPYGEHGVQFSLCIPWFVNVWLTVHYPWLDKFLPERECKSSMRPGDTFTIPEERNIEATIHHGSIWFHLWQRPNEWHATDPWWWSFSWNPKDWLLGMPGYESVVVETTTAKVHLPEKTYEAKVELCIDTWKRPRWPWPHSLERIRFDYGDTPLPHPGKDGYGDCVRKSTVTKAHADLWQAAREESVHVMEARWRYGGFDWLPEGYVLEQEAAEELSAEATAAVDATFDQALAELHESKESPTKEQIFDRATDILLYKLGNDEEPSAGGMVDQAMLPEGYRIADNVDFERFIGLIALTRWLAGLWCTSHDVRLEAAALPPEQYKDYIQTYLPIIQGIHTQTAMRTIGVGTITEDGQPIVSRTLQWLVERVAEEQEEQPSEGGPDLEQKLRANLKRAAEKGRQESEVEG